MYVDIGIHLIIPLHVRRQNYKYVTDTLVCTESYTIHMSDLYALRVKSVQWYYAIVTTKHVNTCWHSTRSYS